MKTRLICILGLLAISLWSTSAFAQATLNVASVPRTTATSTGHTEIAGDILIQMPTAAGAFGAGSSTLTIDYGAPITVPAAGNIIICGTGTLQGGGAACTGGTSYLANATGTSGTFQIGGSNQNQLLIVLPTVAATTGANDAISITGVKVSLAAFTGTKLTATLSTSAPKAFGPFTIGSGQNTTDVISSIAPAFTTVSIPSTSALPVAGLGAGTILSTTTVSKRSFNFEVPENFVDEFKTTLGQSGYLNDPSLTITFNNIPAGVFLNLGGATSGTTNTLCSLAAGTAAGDTPFFYNTTSGATTNIAIGSVSNQVVSQATNSTTLSLTGLGFNLTQLEAIRLRGCIYTSGATAPLAIGTITASISLAPNGSALSSGVQQAIVAGNFPRYQLSAVSATVINIVQAETDMLISYAVKNSSGFDTGISLSNTSTDPFGAINGATPNDGTCTLNFYPQGSGSSFSYTTAAGAPGSGLASGGVLAAGKTWTVGLGELLGAISGAPTTFSGYIFVRCSFTNAHGSAYITDYKGFTSATPFLIVPLGRASVNENLNQ